MADLKDTIRKVNALLAQADHPNTGPAEAEIFRNKAEALMFQYRIDEAMLSTEEKVAQAITVTWMDLDVCDTSSEFIYYYERLVQQVITHLDIRGVSDFFRSEETGKLRRIYKLVGFESDLLFASALFANVRLAFGGKLEPRYDATLTEAENCYNMRQAGMEGVRIAQSVWGDGKKSNCVKARKLAQQWATSIGDDGKAFSGHGMQRYRESYAHGFVQTIASRLRSMREARTVGEMGLVLANRKEQINEALYERYPYLRPMTDEQYEQIRQANPPCQKCVNSKSGYCRDHPKPRKQKARYADPRGVERGNSAARTVDLGITGRQVES